MLRNILAIVSVWAMWFACMGEPIKSSLSLRDVDVYEEEVNYWEWPTEWATNVGLKTPTSVWTPELGKWYGQIASNGYVRWNAQNGSFTDYSVTSRMGSGYGMGVFLSLPSGKYIFEYDCDADSRIDLGEYVQQDGGYVWFSDSMYRRYGYHAEVEFEAEEGLLYSVIFSKNNSSDYATFTNIRIARVGDLEVEE